MIEATTAAGTGGRMRRIAPELYVDCAEAALQVRRGGSGAGISRAHRGQVREDVLHVMRQTFDRKEIMLSVVYFLFVRTIMATVAPATNFVCLEQ